MRIYRFLAATVVTGAISMLTGCSNSPLGGERVTRAGQAAEADDEGDGLAPKTMRDLFQKLGPQPQKFKIKGESGGEIKGESMSLTIPAKSIIDRNGAPLDVDTDGDGEPDAHLVTGEVTVSLSEFKAVGDMVRGGKPTVAVDGPLLRTGGSFVLEAESDKGAQLVIQELVKVDFPKLPNDDGKDMGLWLAPREDEAGWEQPKPVAQNTAQDTGSSYFFNSMPFGSIGNYSAANCDAITYLSATRVTLKVQLPGSLIAEAGVFFLPDNSNTAAKLYTKDTGLPGFVSYVDSMPVGIQGKLIVVALSAGDYYLYHDDTYVIPAGTPVGGVNEETVVISPSIVSESVFTTYMNGL